MCAGANTYAPWSAVVIGFIAGFVYFGLHTAMLKYHLDDPVDAVAVHVGGGVLGLISVPFFANEEGIFWNSEGWKILAANFIGLVVISAWAGMNFLLFVNICSYFSTSAYFYSCLECRHFWDIALF